MMFWNRRPKVEPDIENLAARLKELPMTPVPGAIVARARARVLASIAQPQAPRRLVPRIALAGAIATTLALGGIGAAVAAPSALPGDPLYGLKQAEERLQLILARTPAEVEALRQRHAAIRVEEQRALEARQQGSDADGLRLPWRSEGSPGAGHSPTPGRGH